jgi:hypothetical protein
MIQTELQYYIGIEIDIDTIVFQFSILVQTLTNF